MTSRQRIVELIHMASDGYLKFDENWIKNFMVLLALENPKLADEIQKAAAKKLIELEGTDGQDEATT